MPDGRVSFFEKRVEWDWFIAIASYVPCGMLLA